MMPSEPLGEVEGHACSDDGGQVLVRVRMLRQEYSEGREDEVSVVAMTADILRMPSSRPVTPVSG